MQFLKNHFLEIAYLVSVEVGFLRIIQLSNRQQKNRCVVACLHLRKLGAAVEVLGLFLAQGLAVCSTRRSFRSCLSGWSSRKSQANYSYMLFRLDTMQQ